MTKINFVYVACVCSCARLFFPIFWNKSGANNLVYIFVFVFKSYRFDIYAFVWHLFVVLSFSYCVVDDDDDDEAHKTRMNFIANH